LKFQEKWIDLHVSGTKQNFNKNNMLQRPSERDSKTMFSKLFGSKIRAPSFEASPGGAAENGHDGGKVTCPH
jgi:hypothetical protein